MTSKVVGEGTYGCVLKPPLKCVTNTKTKHLDYNDKVSKIMVDRDAKNEEKEYNNINNIKGLDKYAITAPIYCKPLENTVFDDSVKNCTNERVQRAFRKKNNSLSMLLLQDGGINIKDFMRTVFPKQTLNERKIFLTSLINLFDGLLFFQSNNIIHRDIKLLNIVYNVNNGKTKYIDFGLMIKSQRLRQKTKNNIEDFAVSWSYFPPENSCTNKIKFDDTSIRKCFALKRYFKTHKKFMDFVIKTFDLFSLSLALRGLDYYFIDAGMNVGFIDEFKNLFFTYSVLNPAIRKINIHDLKRDYIILLKKYNYYLKETPDPSPLVEKIVEKLEKKELKKADEKECPPNKPVLNPKTNRCVLKCKPGFIRDKNFRCAKTKVIRKNKIISSNNKSRKKLSIQQITSIEKEKHCKSLNKDYNIKTRRCNKKCKKEQIRDKNFKCVSLKNYARK